MATIHKSFKLKFLHLSARVTTIKDTEGYRAFIVFPKCYMIKGYNNQFLEDIIAASISKACEVAAVHFKQYYSVLDTRMREIGKHNFFIQRMRFRTITDKVIEGNRFTFVSTRHLYAITENVDGEKYPKTKYWTKDTLNTLDAVFFINYEHVLAPMKILGFNSKLAKKLINKHNKVKVKDLRLFDDKRPTIDDVIRQPQLLNYHVIKNREDFHLSMAHRQWKNSQKSL
jgi:hypothetical protein